MTSLRISKNEKNSYYFITCTVRNWYYIFDRYNRFDILADSIKYCQKNKGLKIFSYVFMLNHIHFIGQAPDMIRVLCDFKKFTSYKIMKNMIATEPSVAELFPKINGKYKFWNNTNKPLIIDTDWFFEQKVNYISENPVKKQYVNKPENWYWSSANPKSPIYVHPII